MEFKPVIEMIGKWVDAAGVLVIVAGLVLASAGFLRRIPALGIAGAYKEYRQQVGRAILLGLELLVAGDIIRTVGVDPNLQNVLVLGVIVLIRTFLSMTLELELEGRWPWQSKGPQPAPEATTAAS